MSAPVGPARLPTGPWAVQEALLAVAVLGRRVRRLAGGPAGGARGRW